MFTGGWSKKSSSFLVSLQCLNNATTQHKQQDMGMLKEKSKKSFLTDGVPLFTETRRNISRVNK